MKPSLQILLSPGAELTFWEVIDNSREKPTVVACGFSDAEKLALRTAKLAAQRLRDKK